MPGDAFEVDQPEGERWSSAVALLARGEYIICKGLGLTLDNADPRAPRGPGPVLRVRLQTRHQASQITADQAVAEIENAELGVAEITQRSKAFAELASTREILYELIDDYGMGAIRLALKNRSGFHFEGLR